MPQKKSSEAIARHLPNTECIAAVVLNRLKTESKISSIKI